MTTLLVALLVLWQQQLTEDAISLGSDPYKCLKALKESHEASRAAWHPRDAPEVAPVPAVRIITGYEPCTPPMTQVVPWNMADDVACLEYMLHEAKEREAKAQAVRDREQKAREAMDAVDKACGWGEGK